MVKGNEDRVIQFTAIFLGLYPSLTVLTNEREVYYDKIEGSRIATTANGIIIYLTDRKRELWYLPGNKWSQQCFLIWDKLLCAMRKARSHGE